MRRQFWFMKKVLLIVESPFSKRDFERFGVSTLERFFDVDVFDITAWMRPAFWEKYQDIAISYKNRPAFASFEDIKASLERGGYDFAIDYLAPGLRASRVHRLLKALGIPRCVVAAGPLPAPRTSRWQRLRALRYRTKRLRLLLGAIGQVFINRLGTTAPEYALLAGSASVSFVGAQTRKIWAHSLDYDIFMSLRDRPKPQQRYAVYADEDVAYHSDLAALHIKPFVTPEEFYPALTAFFDRFERETGLKVVIAAHPRSRWDLRAELLNGREAVYGRTAELMLGAELVFAHASTSISFAVLSRVPVALITSDELNDSFYGDEIRVRADLFGVDPVNIDHLRPANFDLALLRRLNQAAYDEYREKYIKMAGTPDLPSWEIFARAILEDANDLRRKRPPTS